jgi:hypothetical protein
MADTADRRIYYTGDGAPKKTNWTLASAGAGPYPDAYRAMGVPAPTTKPTVAATAGSSVAADSRYYVYTYVSTFGSLTEESAPSPPSDLVTITASQSVNLSAFVNPSTLGGDYNITHIRVYRTQTGQTSSGTYAYVGQITVSSFNFSSGTFNDNLLAAALGEALGTIGWTPPPTGMQGIVSMANGMLAAFSDNVVYFCEPYYPHAWPASYSQSIPERIVGLGAYGTNLVVMTTSQPYIMTGITPSSVSVEKLLLPEPCVSKKSIVADEAGVLYASPNGLVSVGPSARAVVTNKLFRRDEWQSYAPETIRGEIYDGKYIGAFSSPTYGNKAMVLSRDDRPALSFLSLESADLFVDQTASELFFLDSATLEIYQADSDSLNPRIYEWRSRKFLLPRAATFSVLRVDLDAEQIENNELYAEQAAAIAAQNAILFEDPLLGALNETPLNTYLANGSTLVETPTSTAPLSATVTLYGDVGALEASLPVRSAEPIRIPPFKAREITIGISGTINVRTIAIATTVAELRG